MPASSKVATARNAEMVSHQRSAVPRRRFFISNDCNLSRFLHRGLQAGHGERDEGEHHGQRSQNDRRRRTRGSCGNCFQVLFESRPDSFLVIGVVHGSDGVRQSPSAQVWKAEILDLFHLLCQLLESGKAVEGRSVGGPARSTDPDLGREDDVGPRRDSVDEAGVAVITAGVVVKLNPRDVGLLNDLIAQAQVASNGKRVASNGKRFAIGAVVLAGALGSRRDVVVLLGILIEVDVHLFEQAVPASAVLALNVHVHAVENGVAEGAECGNIAIQTTQEEVPHVFS